MEISFIIPLYNRLDLAQPCVETLRASLPAGLDHEIILADDASTDGTREWAASLGQQGSPFVYLPNERNLRYAGTCNRAAAISRGRMLALLNQDLVFAPGWLEPMLQVLTTRRSTGIVGNIHVRADTLALDHAGIGISIRGKIEHLDGSQRILHLWRRSARRPAITSACCLIQRDLFIEMGGFDESYRNGGEDVDLCFKLRHRGLQVRVAHRSRVRHHVSASPGRKDFDEENSRLLCARWRSQLIFDGAASWPFTYLRQHWTDPRHFDAKLAWQALLRWLGVVSTPTWHARRLVEHNIALEEKRWRDLLGPGTQVS